MIGLYFLLLVSVYAIHVARDSVFGIATPYLLEGPVGRENMHPFLPTLGPIQPSYSRYRSSFLGKAAGTWLWSSTPHLAPRLKKEWSCNSITLWVFAFNLCYVFQ